MAIKLIVGLGNPGPQYERTRHNAGAWFVQALADTHRIGLSLDQKAKALVARATLYDHDMRFCIPITFMNLSGHSVAYVAKFFKFAPDEILVAHDELDLPVGSVRLKLDGGHGGHNGLLDIAAQLGTKAFYRLRIGIGRPLLKEDVTDYVLHAPTKGEHQNIMDAIQKALNVLPDIVSGQTSKAMNTLHTNA